MRKTLPPTIPGGVARAVSLTDPESIDAMRLITLKHAIKLYAQTGLVPTRGMTITKMLAEVTRLTQRRYTGKERFSCAIRDLDNIIEFRKNEIIRKRARNSNAQD